MRSSDLLLEMSALDLGSDLAKELGDTKERMPVRGASGKARLLRSSRIHSLGPFSSHSSTCARPTSKDRRGRSRGGQVWWSREVQASAWGRENFWPGSYTPSSIYEITNDCNQGPTVQLDAFSWVYR
jgi:hypothetical protein